MPKNYENTFSTREIYKDTYCIVDNAMGTVNLFLLVGSERALLIDSGYGHPKLLDTVRAITDKEVICACTHGHVDHALGGYLFEKAYLHSEDFSLYDRHRAEAMIRSCGVDGIGAKPKKLLKTPGYLENVELLANIERKKLLPLENVKCFDLGDRTVSWHLIPGHTPGSVAFVDEENHIAFDGDAAGNGVWLFMPEATELEEFARSIRNYKAFLDSKGVKHRYGGHAQQPLATDHLIQLQALCDETIKKQKAGKHTGFPMHFSVGNARLALKGRTAMFIKP